MSRTASLLLVVAAVVAAGAFAFHVLAPAPDPAPDPVPSVADAGGSDDEAALEIARRLDRLEERVFQPRLAPHDPSHLLAALDERLRALEVHPAPSETAAAPASAFAAETDASSAEPVDLRSVSDEDLVTKARTLAGKQARDLAAPFWREVIARGADDEILVEANLELGYAHRGAKEHDQEEAAFREAIRIAGEDSAKGQWANYQIAWSESFRGDHAAARDRMAAVARSPATERNLTGHARLYVAHFSLELNDPDRAREAMQSVLRDFGASVRPDDAWLAEQAKKMLEKLE